MPNAIVKSRSEHKVFVSDEVEHCNDFSALQQRLSLERSCLVNWDTQAEVWARAFGPSVLNVNPADCSLLLSETPMCPASIQDTLDEMVFEHFGFGSYCTRPAPVLAALAVQELQFASAAQPAVRPAALVIDAGFSGTHIMPIFGGKPLNFATKRLNVGGKLLTNHLKQVVSYRSFNVMDETHLVNDAKERLCYVSLDAANDFALSRFRGKRNTLRREFIMPDYVTNFRGRIREPHNLDPSFAPSAKSGPEKAADVGPPKKKANTSSDEQVLALSSERISVPEVFFCPSDIGIDQAGLAECCVQAVGSCLPDIREALYSNIILTGGSTLFPNLQKRLERELRETVPSDMSLQVTQAQDPSLAAWRGGSILAGGDMYAAHTVTRKEYNEHGHSLCRRRFLA